MNIQSNVRIKDFPNFVETLITQFKAKKFRVCWIKKDGTKRVGKFDIVYRVRWKQSDGSMYKRKNKARTTDPMKFLQAYDLEDNRTPKNINYATMKWLNVGKKFYKINHLKTKVKVIEFPKVEFDIKKDLLNGKWDILENIK